MINRMMIDLSLARVVKSAGNYQEFNGIFYFNILIIGMKLLGYTQKMVIIK